MKLPPVIAKLCYALLLSSLRHTSSSPVPPKTGFLKESSRYRRTASLIQSIDDLIPGVPLTDLWIQWIYKNNRFPWVPVETELIASGTGAAVIKVSWQGAEKVLRIYRRSLGKSRSGLLGVIAHYKSNYETLLSWYGNSHNLVLPMCFLALQGPSLVGPVAASLQPFIHGERYDLFEDFSDSGLLALLKENDRLREQFLYFAEQTLRQWQERKMCIDFLGRQNIMLVDDRGRYSLRILDCGIFRLDHSESKHNRHKAQVERRLDRLAFLYKRAMANTTGTNGSFVPAIQ